MKRYLTLFFLLITSLALCAYPEGAINNIDGSVLGWDNNNQVWRPVSVDENGKLSGGESSTIASISIDTGNIESYLRVGDGQTATETIADLTDKIESYLKIVEDEGGVGESTTTITEYVSVMSDDVASISENLGNSVVNAIHTGTQPNYFKTNRLSSISASTATAVTAISTGGGTNRVFVELRAIDPDTEFYIGFDDTVTDSTGRPVKGRILLDMPSTQALYIYHINASAIDIQQTEGWR